MSKQIDDQDGSVVYSNPDSGVHWSTYSGTNEYLGTASLARTRGANAKIKFSGSSIGVYGTISPISAATSGTTSRYIIDGGPSVSFTTSPTKDTQYGFRLFQSSLLSPGDHALEITNESEGGWLWLDYFVVTTAGTAGSSGVAIAAPSTGNSTASPSNSTASGASPPSISSITSQLSPSIPDSNGSQPWTVTRIVGGSSTGADVTPTSTPPSLDSSGDAHISHSPPAGTIIGSILGGVFGILVLVALFWCLRRKRADRFADEAAAIPSSPSLTTLPNGQNFPRPDQTRGSLVVAPFDPPGGPSHQNMSQVHNQYGPNTSGAYPFLAEPQCHHDQGPGMRMSAQQYRPSPQAGMSSSGLSHGAVNSPHMQTHQQDMSFGAGFGPAANGSGAISSRASTQSLKQSFYADPVAGLCTAPDSLPAYTSYSRSMVTTTSRDKF